MTPAVILGMPPEKAAVTLTHSCRELPVLRQVAIIGGRWWACVCITCGEVEVPENFWAGGGQVGGETGWEGGDGYWRHQSKPGSYPYTHVSPPLLSCVLHQLNGRHSSEKICWGSRGLTQGKEGMGIGSWCTLRRPLELPTCRMQCALCWRGHIGRWGLSRIGLKTQEDPLVWLSVFCWFYFNNWWFSVSTRRKFLLMSQPKEEMDKGKVHSFPW